MHYKIKWRNAISDLFVDYLYESSYLLRNTNELFTEVYRIAQAKSEYGRTGSGLTKYTLTVKLNIHGAVISCMLGMRKRY